MSLPTGTVTFLFTDIEGSTRLLQELGEGYRRVLDDHTALMRKAIAEGEGVEISTEGDSFFAVFPAATGAVRAAADTARTTFLETMAMHEHMGNRTGITIALDNLAAREIALGNLERAVRLGGASQAIKESAGGQAPPELIDHPDPRGLARGSLVEESIARAWEEGRGMSLEEAVAYAREGT